MKPDKKQYYGADMKPSRSQWKKCRKCVWKTKIDVLHYFCPWPECIQRGKPNEKFSALRKTGLSEEQSLKTVITAMVKKLDGGK